MVIYDLDDTPNNFTQENKHLHWKKDMLEDYEALIRNKM